MSYNGEFEKEPCVIDEAIIYNAIINQGPKGEGGKLFKDQGISYATIQHIRLDFLDIVHIDHLWILKGLTKLQLSNNCIQEISNLEELVNLKELDLSFNNISKIQNLNNLELLEVFSVFENKIIRLENMDSLKCLKVFSAGNNKLTDKNDIFYLRKFENLKSLNLAGNPMCQVPDFHQFIYAYLPKLVYYEYRMISKHERLEAKKLFGADLTALEESEKLINEEEKLKYKEIEQEELNKAGFVEYLGGNHLFHELFKIDAEGKAILQMGDEISDSYKEYMKNFVGVSKEIHAWGIEQYNARQAEVSEYEKSVKGAKQKSFFESRKLLEEFLIEKKVMFDEVKKMLDTDEDDETIMAQISINIQQINETFQQLCLKTWQTLMQRELFLFEAMEKVNENLGRNLTQLINEFVEVAQAKFTQLRTLETIYFEASTEIAHRYITRLTILLSSNKDASHNISPDLMKVMTDKESLTSATAASHDNHLQVIDQREDQLVSSAKIWLKNYLEDLISAEVSRSRNQIIEMNHFLDSQKEELQAMMATPMGLLMLPTEIQEALHIK